MERAKHSGKSVFGFVRQCFDLMIGNNQNIFRLHPRNSNTLTAGLCHLVHNMICFEEIFARGLTYLDIILV